MKIAALEICAGSQQFVCNLSGHLLAAQTLSLRKLTLKSF